MFFSVVSKTFALERRFLDCLRNDLADFYERRSFRYAVFGIFDFNARMGIIESLIFRFRPLFGAVNNGKTPVDIAAEPTFLLCSEHDANRNGVLRQHGKIEFRTRSILTDTYFPHLVFNADRGRICNRQRNLERLGFYQLLRFILHTYCAPYFIRSVCFGTRIKIVIFICTIFACKSISSKRFYVAVIVCRRNFQRASYRAQVSVIM